MEDEIQKAMRLLQKAGEEQKMEGEEEWGEVGLMGKRGSLERGRRVTRWREQGAGGGREGGRRAS